MISVQGKHQLKDGFQELFIFRGHRLQLRGFNLVEWLEDNNRGVEYKLRFHYYISWDVKQVLLWKHDFQSFNSKPQLMHQVKFSNQPNYVCAIVHVTKMKVFLAAALDMSFKIFDRQLNLLESIRHEERAILQLEYDSSRDIIFSSGATGISAWRLYRNISLDKSHVMEKLYSFEGCEPWVTHMIYEPSYNRIYALKERSAQVLSLTRRTVITTLENVHDAPINAICWYERNQFYITGCSRGEIKCWTSNFNYRKAASDSATTTAFNYNANATQNPLGDDMLDDHHNNNPSSNHHASSAGKKFALLHVFKGHTKAVTAIRLHPVSGLAISTSLDGFVKILNLEALNELFVLQCDAGILSMRVLHLGTNHHACLFSFDDATIRLWKITSVVDFFAVTSAKIDSFQIFDNLEGELEYYYLHSKHNTNVSILKNSLGEYHIPALFQGREMQPMKAIASSNATNNMIADMNTKTNGNNNNNADDDDDANEKGNDEGSALMDKIIICESTQDFRAFTHTGTLLGRLEPEHVVDSIKSYTVSVHQKLLICLSEGDKIRVHCLRRFGFPLLFETNLKGPLITKRETKKHENDENPATETTIFDNLGTCITLIDIVPTGAIRSPRANANYTDDYQHPIMGGARALNQGPVQFGLKTDIRGEQVPDFMECFLLVGLNTGTILFMDLYNNLEVILSTQAIHGCIMELKYRKKFHQLFMYGKDFTHVLSTVKIYQLPDMELTHEVNELKHVSCFNISLNLNFFGVGTTNGSIKLFSHHNEDRTITENVHSSENHENRINSIIFCDDLRIYISCSQDNTVIFWDYEKRLIRSIIFNIPSCSLILNGLLGDVVVSQNQYLLTIPRRIWDEDDILESMKYEQVEDQQNYVESSSSSVANNGKQKQDADSSSSVVSPVPHQPAGGGNKDIRRGSRVRSNSVRANDNNSVVSALSEPTVTNNEKEKAAPPISENSSKLSSHRNSVADRRMSRKGGSGFDLSKKRTSVSMNNRLNGRKSSRQGIVLLPTTSDDPSSIANNAENATATGDKSTAGEEERNIDRMVDNIKELFEREIILPAIHDGRFEYVGKNVSSLKKLVGVADVVNFLEDSKVEHSSITFDQSSSNVHHSHSHHPQQASSRIPQPPAKPVPHPPHSQYQQPAPEPAPIVSSAFDVFFVNAQPTKPKYDKPSSANGPSGSYDVLHPKFIIHKKPPARAMKLEDIEQKLYEYKEKLIQKNDSAAGLGNSDELENMKHNSTRINSRRFAQFGLSPRARMTLLNSYAADNLNEALSLPLDLDHHANASHHFSTQQNTSISPDKRRASVLLTTAQQQTESPVYHGHLDANAEKIVEANLEFKLQEQLVVGLGLGMKVSSQYKQQRMTMKKNDTFSKLQEKIVQSTNTLRKKSVSNALQDDEQKYNELVRNSKKLASPRAGVVGRQGLGLDYPTALDDRSIEQSIMEEEGDGEDWDDGALFGHHGEDPMNEMKQNELQQSTPTTTQQPEEEEDSEANTPNAQKGPQYNRRKPLLPVNFNPKKIK